MDISPSTFSPLFLVLVCGSEMVNANHVKRKLPSLLCAGPTTAKGNWNQHNKIVYRLQRFKTRNPKKFDTLYNDLISVLEKFERALFAN